MPSADALEAIAADYRRFGRVEARGKSPLYEHLCERLADDEEMLRFIAEQPEAKRQPNLLLAAVRFLFGTQRSYERLRSAVLTHRDEVAAILRARRTQTNEPGRCAVLLPLMSRLASPLALLEVGASAGLCLLIEHYGYDYDGYRIGHDDLVFPCSPHGGVPLPSRVPDVAWRAGIDLDPIDPDDPAAVRWLEALVWPEDRDRLDRLSRAIEIARRERPNVVRGHVLDRLADVASEAPRDATLVVYHTSVLAYLSPAERHEFAVGVASLGAEWISSEGPDVLDGVPVPPVQPVAPSHHVVVQNGRDAVALSDPHGRWIQWLASP